MRKNILLFLCVFCCQVVEAQERPKVALVLSGGGAKGMAHIGAIEVIEQAGIPIDIIVGTSMGSIVGGLYSIGYDAKSLKEMVKSQNWNFLLSDRVTLDNLSVIDKSRAERYLLSIPYNQRKMPVGMIDGHNLMRLFADLTIGYHDSLNFDSLPIPYRAVAMNAVDGSEIILRDGHLMTAMRASMAIPAVFSPVILDSLVLVDGGLANNFPVDVAKAMGADIIIGVDVQSDLKEMSELNSFVGMMGQLVDVLCLNKYASNKSMTDVYIHPNVRGYTSASFTASAVDSLINRGFVAALDQWSQLLKVKERLGEVDSVPFRKKELIDSIYINNITLVGIRNTDEKWLRRMLRVKENSMISLKDIEKSISILYGTKRFGEVNYRLLNRPNYDLELSFVEENMNAINVGFRYDSEDVAAILINTRLNTPFLRASYFELTTRLSTNPYLKLEYAIEDMLFHRFVASYTYRKNDFMFYNRGDKYVNVEYATNSLGFSLSKFNSHNFLFEINARYDFVHYEPFLYSKATEGFIDVKSDNYLIYNAKLQYESLNRRYFPTKGSRVRMMADVYTDNGYYLNDRTPSCAISADFMTTISITSRFKCVPSLQGRVITGKNTPFPYLNIFGGYYSMQYVPQQIPFWGVPQVELMPNSLVIGKLHFHQRAGARHYFSLIGNMVLYDNNFFDMTTDFPASYGGALGYSYYTEAGPVELYLNYSDYTKSLGYYFSVGFYF